VYNSENRGFAAAQNQAIAMARGHWILTLNPDVLLLPDFIRSLLLTIKSSFDLPDKPLVDSTGIYFTPMLRHLDRGSQEVDNGHYLHNEYVFGATAAAALYRRDMVEDVAVDGDFFDSDFFVYREDADVAWRAQLLGWRCIYTPHARAYHVRKVLPGNRRALPDVINMHSVKNRFLMRMKNITPAVYRKNWFSITVRDLVVLSCCLLREHTSLKAFAYVVRNWGRVLEKRREIMRRVRVSDEYMASWFSYHPVSRPAPRTPVRLVQQKAARGR
jgi:GT2 family glycosyltransferase